MRLFEIILRQEIRRRLKKLMPKPDCRPARLVMPSNTTFIELSQPPEIPPTMASVVEFHGPADTQNGYKSTGSIVVLNKAGRPLVPQPDFSTLTITKDDVAIPAASVDADGRVLFNPSDDLVPASVSDITISAVEGDADDLIVRFTCDPDRLATIDGGALGTFEEVVTA